MIIVKTPLRISFMGGGSDIPQFYKRSPGATLSTAIDKYVYVCLNKKFDEKIRVSYSQTEIVDTLQKLEHTRAKACMKHTGINKGIEIVTIADIPSKGTGLGSSSSFTVGLLKALYAYQGKTVSEEQLADEACQIEIGKLKEPIGKQDQYIASYGGMKFMEYSPNGHVSVSPIICSSNTLKKIEDSLLLFYTGITRQTGSLLKNQIAGLSDKQKFQNTEKMVQMAHEMRKAIENNKTGEIGEMLHEAWLLKKTLNGGISNGEIDSMYNTAIKNGAEGGKILGAGGGGFLMVYASKNNHEKIKSALKKYKEMPINFEPEGSRVLFVHKHHE
ncbi:MAG: GHMP kinase [Candidatus Parcubacteria bacterium]|nr:GHMP kinase [Candidatus Parcubacteria bacterium]